MEERFLVLWVICSHFFFFYCSHWFHILRTIHETLRTVFLNNIFFLASHFKCNVWKKSLYRSMNIEKYQRLRRVSLLMFLCRVRPEMSFQLLKRHFWPNSFKFCFIFFVPWFHYRIKGKNNSIFILGSFSHLSESFSAFC